MHSSLEVLCATMRIHACTWCASLLPPFCVSGWADQGPSRAAHAPRVCLVIIIMRWLLLHPDSWAGDMLRSWHVGSHAPMPQGAIWSSERTRLQLLCALNG